ncbi:hypothetical protein Q7C36_020280 [Tachysurus vachellii]|uniref:Uncharacterized protein n=1 Tax=Tachysurus vachellii TaxID=175792 RepID=A0AA88RXE2_TACVA|nr:hypothetical protein Q7C36_020280 [Tachysurus vachellii]
MVLLYFTDNSSCPADSFLADYLIEIEIDASVLDALQNSLEFLVFFNDSFNNFSSINININVTDINLTTADYLIEFEIDALDGTVQNLLRNILEANNLPLINSNINITDINITTVCNLTGTEYQCRCEDQYFWPCEKCTLYGSCNNITNVSCGCINALPNDGHFCQPINELTNNSTCPVEPFLADYLIEFEIDALDGTVQNLLRNILEANNLPLINSNINITDINITTVCNLTGTEYQCRCEDQYFWPCEKCTLYGSCNNITNVSCGCINALPNDGHFCQPINELTNNSTCPVEPFLADYLIEFEIDALDGTVQNLLRNILEANNLPLINSNINITDINITTVCNLTGTEYQCRCEDQYFWPCEKCTLYGSCNNITNVSCGCINALPNDGHFCQPINELTTDYLIEFEIDALDGTVQNLLRNILEANNLPLINSNINITDINITTVCNLTGTEYQCRCEDQYFWPCEKCTLYGSCNNVTNVSCGCINALPNDGHFCQPINELTTEYLIEFEIDALDGTVQNLLRNILEANNLPLINSNINITDINITTVCNLTGTEYQCRCEDQYFWPCEKCTLYGSCNNVTNVSCGCINTLPKDGHFCQPINELKTDYLIEVEISAVDVTVQNLLRNILERSNLPLIYSDISITDINITTVCNLTGTEYQCRCEDQYFWPCEKCTLYGSCNNITNVSCGCINALPNDGHFCQPINELTTDYLIEFEIDALDGTVQNLLRNILEANNLPLINSNINITDINITTVCNLTGTEYQCRCEDQYFWPCEKCTLYGSCNNVTNVSCGCINTLPKDGHFCQPINELKTDYLIEVEISAVDVTVQNLLRNILERSNLPLIYSDISITDINITTVCNLTGTEYQCRCEDQYFWPCEKCTLYGSCNNVTNVSCGCINALPNDGHFCQPINELMNDYLIEFEIDTGETFLNDLRIILETHSLPLINSDININDVNITTVCSLAGTEYQCRCEDQYFWPCEKCTLYGSCNNVTNSSCGCINALPNDGHFCQPINELMNNAACPTEPLPADYLIEVEIAAADVNIQYLLRNLLERSNLPLINSDINITDINITTVCSLTGTEYQCRCEDQYFWPCEKCTQYGSCNNVTNSSCGCINALPNDGHFCQPINELMNNAACPTEPLPVCSLTGTEYQCRCEDQYFWPCEKCTLYGSCNNITNSSCGCINALPNDGHFCQPINELMNNAACPTEPLPADYMIEFEIDAEDIMVQNLLRSLLGTNSLPLINSDISITDITITTVCSLAGTEYQCRCEDQYFWPCEKCTLYGSCNNVTNSSCGCINALPNDGHFCQPINELITDYMIEFEIDAVDIMVQNLLRSLSGTNSLFLINSDISITDINITTVCSLIGATYHCSCENQYFWPCEKCTLYGSCNNDTESSCSCINAFPNDGQFCQPINELITIHILTFSMVINENFDLLLTDTSSTKYKTYKTTIENSINKSYSTVPGHQANSATVTNFRPGSVITDFTIKATSTSLDLVSANQNLASSLRSQGFNVSDNAFSQSVKDGLYQSNGIIYPGTNLNLSCNPPVLNGIQWTLNGAPLSESSNILLLNNATSSNSGQYACSTTVNSLPYVIWQTITIQPYPNIEVSTDKTLQCKTDTIPLKCCVQLMYQLEWGTACSSPSTDPTTGCIFCNYPVNQKQCETNGQNIQVSCQLKTPISGITNPSYNSKSITLNIINKKFYCSDSVFGAGNLGDTHNGDCGENMVGYQVAQCNTSNLWNIIEDHCVLLIFVLLKEESKTVPLENIPQFMFNISSNVTSEIKNIVKSPDTILTLVETLTTISSRCQAISINQPVMTDFLKITDVIGSEGAQNSWVILNKNNTTMNASSVLLNSIESIARRLLDDNTTITTNLSSFNKLTFSSVTTSFSGTFGKNSTTQINIPMTKASMSLTVIISLAFNNILPVRNLTYNNSSQNDTKINGDVAVIETNSTINNISLSFDVINTTLGKPQCVFWNFNLLNGVGGWDSTGCQLKLFGNETKRYTCECNHTTSFSILMSPFTLDEVQVLILDYITYIGVGISMGSLVLCLIIEIIIWKSVTRNDTSYMRHVSIVNIAVSLLIANICFIIGAAVVKQEGPCSTATFFMHFFYLALFFWMLLSALLLLYRTLMVFSRMTRGAMMAIGFTVGYGAPLIIAVVTVASTAGGKGYIQQGYNCWLNWNKTKALLAFVIPALTIVAINLLVLIVVLCKMLRRGVNASTQPDEKHPLVVIARCVAILTPLFGLTWGFGIGTLVSGNFGIHVVFAFFNSLQGFFILVFGTLLDSKVREALAGKFSLRNLSSGRTRSTSAGPTSSSGLPFMQRLRQRNVYNVSNGEMLSSSNTNASVDG